MTDVYRLALIAHIAAGLCGLVAFWVPAFARKGHAAHVQVGRVFFYATAAVAATGTVMAALLLADPLAVKPLAAAVPAERAADIAWQVRLTSVFLFYLVLITFAPVHHGVRVLATRRDPPRLRTPFHTAINAAVIAASAAMVALGASTGRPVFLALSPIGFLVGSGNLKFARRPYPTPMAWWYEHMGSMIGGGVAFHTAFLVLGAGRLLGITIEGPAALVPWLLPTIVGVPASAIWVGYYRRRFAGESFRVQAALNPEPFSEP
jgi:hypothetical protein